MNVIVAGASGRLGRRVCQALAERKIAHIGLVRNREAGAGLPARTRGRVVDYENVESLRQAMAGATHVINCAGLVDETASEQALQKANALTVRHLLQACPPDLVRFVQVSSISIYGPHPPRGANEFTQGHARSAYGRSKWAGEREAMRAAHRLPVVILRPGMIYGPEFEEGFYPMLRQLKSGRARIIGDGENIVPLVHAQDVVVGILRALQTRAPSGSAFLLVSPERVTQREALERAAHGLGVPAPTQHLPTPLVYAMAGGHRLLAHLGGRKSSLTPSMVLQLAANREFDPHRARKLLGWAPTMSFKDGLAQVIRRFRSSS